MKHFFTTVLLIGLNLSFYSQQESKNQFVRSEDILGTRVFIENKGQFENPLDKSEKVLFMYDHRDERVYFTEKGLIYEMVDKYSMTEEEREAIEHGQPSDFKEPEKHYVRMSWLNSFDFKHAEASDKQSHYFTYGYADLNASTFKKITYLNVYPNIDIEYTIPKDKNAGIKYNVIVHPGGDYTQVKIGYSGDVKKIKLLSNGDLSITTGVETIVEHAPASFDNTDKVVESSFVVEDNVIGFKLPTTLDQSKGFVIDPWVTAITTLSNNNYGYDVDYDFAGNTFVYGGNGSNTTTGKFKVAKYNSAGVLLWTFSGIVTSTGWQSGNNWSCNFKVNKGTGKTYVGRNNAVPYLIRLDANGNYDNFVSASGSPNVQEVWNMEFNCSGDIQIFGGGSTSGGIISTTTGAVSNVTTFSPGVTGCCQDVVAVAVDAVGNTFVTYLGHSILQNKIALIAPSYTNSVWLSPTNFSSLGYLAVKNGYVAAGVGSAVAFNALAVNMNYLYYYDGSHLGVYNKTNGVMISSITSTLTAGAQGGVAVDDCDNVYVGGNGYIMCYHFNGTNFSTLTPLSLNTSSLAYSYVYDIQINKMTNQLYVTGSGFVANYAAAYSSTCGLANVQNPCNFGQFALVASTNSINCANLLGSATVTPIGGVGPFTYTWLPSGQNGSVSTGLGPGSYTVISYDSGANYSFTSNITFTPSVPLTANVISTGILNCFGLTNGTAAIANITGGSGSQTYSWTIGNTTQTTAVVNNLSVGNYSVTITDALTYCAYSETFAILQPQQLGVMIFANNPTVCAGQSTTLTAIGSGGSPGYTFAWNGGPTTDTFVVNSATAGINSYSIATLDSHGCLTNGVTSVTFVPNPTLTVTDATICPLEIGTMTVTGATSYTWNNSATGTTFSDTPLANQVYTVLGSAQSCTSATTGNILLKSVPVPTLVSNSPVCTGQNLTFTALGGISSVWTGPQSYSSLLQSNTISASSPFHNGTYNVTITAVNACTASAVISLSVHATPSLSAAGSTVCSNQTMSLTSQSLPGSTYLWTGPSGYVSFNQNPTVVNPASSASGSYMVKATSPQGCTNTAITQVTVTTLPSIFPSNNSPLCFGDNLNFNANCTGGLSFAWNGPAGFNSLLQNPSINSISLPYNGSYTLTVTAGPCIKTGVTNVLVYPLPSPIAANTGPVCELRPLVLSVSTPSNNTITAYVWQGPANFVSYTSQGNIAVTQLNQTGIYTVMVTDNHGCKNNNTTTVTILANPTVTAVGDTVCLYQPAELKGFGGNSYQWFSTTGNFSSLPIAVITKAGSLAPTVYTVIGTAANTCTASATATLFTWALPQPSASVWPSNAACVNNIFNFDAQGALYYTWNGPGNRQYAGQNLHIFANNLSYSGVYTVTGIDINNCRSDYTTQITVYNLPEGYVSKGIREACVPFTSEYVFSPAAANSSITQFSWEVNGKTYTTQSFSTTFTKPGNYMLKAKIGDANGCANTLTLFVNAWPQPVANFNYSPSNPVENIDEVEFNSTATGTAITEWNWFFAPDINENRGFTSNKEITHYLFKEAGNYPVALVIKNQNGCADSIVKVIHVDEDYNVYVPTAFTPNGDKINDFFMPVTRGIKAYHFYVFDRWDELMFESTDPTQGWNGIHKGKECKQDVYVWKLIVTSKKGDQKIYTGQISLLK